MQFSNIGILANVFWHEIKNHAKNIELGEFVVMPNHVHGILILHPDDNSDYENIRDQLNDGILDGAISDGPISDGAISDVQTRHALSLAGSGSGSESESQKLIGQKRFQNPGKNSISSIIGGYKSAVTKHAHRLGYQFEWQTRFHDHIIRDDKSFQNISHYIINNPKKWDEDKFHGHGI
ncbi:transposase [Flavobacteriaceae bacterium F89]|uniref:Transposase n=1 Tax=Cerina litoralis TaxID=2874477 RepID=A0AAE3EV45_9FLAO|nr:transposase [Cerina litoralis]